MYLIYIAANLKSYVKQMMMGREGKKWKGNQLIHNNDKSDHTPVCANTYRELNKSHFDHFCYLRRIRNDRNIYSTKDKSVSNNECVYTNEIKKLSIGDKSKKKKRMEEKNRMHAKICTGNDKRQNIL